MLEVPVYAFLIWGIYFFVEYIKTEKIYQLYLSIALLVLGLYIKTPIAFIAIPLLFVLLRKRGLDVFKDKHTYIIAFLAIVGIIPLVYITLEFGQVNLQAVTDIADAEVDKYSLSGLLWYLLQTPSQLGIGHISLSYIQTYILPYDEYIFSQHFKLHNLSRKRINSVNSSFQHIALNHRANSRWRTGINQIARF